MELYNTTPLLRLKVKKKNKGHKDELIHVEMNLDELIHVEDLLVCGPLTDLRSLAGLM